jgi:hypothetical protein
MERVQTMFPKIIGFVVQIGLQITYTNNAGKFSEGSYTRITMDNDG